MKDVGNVTRDDAGNSFFNVNDRTYKLPRINWHYEERFLIAMSNAGIDLMGSNGDKKSIEFNLFTDNGTELRKTLIPWLFFKESENSFIQLDEDYQLTHFKSVIEVYEVLSMAIEAITYFLSQAQANNQANSSQQRANSSEKANTLKTPNQTSKK